MDNLKKSWLVCVGQIHGWAVNPVVPRILCILQMSDNFNMVPQGKVHPCPISLQ